MPLDFVVVCLPWEEMVHPTTEQMGKALWATEGTANPGVHTFPLGI